MGARLPKRGHFWAVPALLAIALPLLPLAAAAESLFINEFNGLNPDHSPATLTRGQTPDSENVVTDEGPGLQPRQGFTLCKASSATAQWVFPYSSGTRYQIIQSGGVLKADIGDCTFAITVSTVASGVDTTAAVLGGKFFFGNTTDGLKYWDTSAVAVASATLKPTQLVTHKNRLWAAGMVSDPRTVRASAFGDGTTWNLVTDPAVTDPAVFVIGGAVDEVLTALYSSHRDALVWMKSRSFGVISGNDRSNFEVRTYSDNVGTAYPDSVRDCDGLLRWLGPARTIYEWNGSELVNIGKHIKTQLAAISQGDANSRAYQITTQTDWETGTIGTGLTATDSPGDLEPGDVVIDSFTDGNTSSSPAWTDGASDADVSFSAATGELVWVDATQASGGSEYMYTTNPNTGNAGYWGVTHVAWENGDTIAFGISNSAAPVGVTHNSYSLTAQYCSPSSCGGAGLLTLGLFENSSLMTGAYAQFAYPGDGFTLGISRSTSNVISAYVNGVMRSSATDSSYTSFATVALGTSFSGGGGYSDIVVDDVIYRVFSSTYVSASFSLGSISQYGIFESASVADGGTLTYAIYTDTDSTKTVSGGVPVAGTWISSQAITSGSIPTLSTAAYAFITESFAVSDVIQQPVTDSLTLRWTEGSTTKTPSAWFRQRYWLGVAQNSATNNLVLVFDRNREWQRYRGVSASALAIYNGSLFFGNSAGVYQYETGYTDAGSAISSYYRTGTLSPAGPNLAAVFNEVQVTADSSAETLATTYQVNDVATDYSLRGYVMNTASGLQNFRLAFPFDQVQQARNLSLKFAVSGTTFWRILGATLDFVPDLVPE